MIKFVVIGLGHIGRRHAALIAAHPGASLLAYCDPVSPRKDQWPLGIPEEVAHFSSLEELLDHGPEFDVACICTPNGLHAPQAVRLLRAGAHVVIEKPLALTEADGLSIIRAAEESKRKVFGVMQNRYSPASAWLKEQLESESLGEILQVHINCFWNRDHRYYTLPPDGRPHPWHGHPQLDGGVLFTQFAHFIDLLLWCFGEVTVLNARFVNQNHEDLHTFADSGTVLFQLRGRPETLGSLNFSTAIWNRNFESTLTVIGRRGTIKLGGQYMNEVRYCEVEEVPLPDLPRSQPANNYGPYTGSAANHHFVIDNVVNVLTGAGRVATTAQEGVAVVRLIEDIYRAGQL
ncbi:Gfo/Idh/MocA family protein [Lewinella sp. W8]|uniref:Gfo/Idh/MocA family protein n=1 Tax=Lewinella sp. W8 TaxID=2528208 RepID=UPI0012B5CD76|nr:Gfo/Idh/MocA family oxidoreductase [Lewinella sp. W8]